MLIDQKGFSCMLCGAARIWLENASTLSEIDSRYGDGDHGVTIEKIARLILAKVESWDLSIKELLEELGAGIMAIGGGSAGPLYGTLVGGLGEALDGQAEIDGTLLKQMLAASLSEMQDITTANIGDKTMMDALIPAVEAALKSADDIPSILEAAAVAAANGADNSKNFASKFGRARSYGDQTIGTPDAGAVSTSLFFAGLRDGFSVYSND